MKKLNKAHYLYQEDINNVLSIKDIQNFKNKSFLITGATGLIGVHLIDVLMTLGNVKIYAIGRNKQNASSRLGEYYNHPNFNFIEQDVCTPLPKDLNVDYIIPGASNTHPLAYSQYPVETIMINIKGAEYALNLAKECNATVLYLSTVEIYGNAVGNEIFTEDYTGKLNLSTSRSCYTESKRLCEAMCQSYISEYKLNIKIARLSRVFGPTMLENDSKASSQFIKNAINNENIILKSQGNQYFSYTYISDVVAAMLQILLQGEVGIPYNISNENMNVHLKDFAQICAAYNKQEVIYELPTEIEKKGYSTAINAILDNTRLKNIGFIPRYTMKDAIKRTIEILK